MLKINVCSDILLWPYKKNIILCSFLVSVYCIYFLQPFIVVENQKDPDPEFPTVKFPNPEEGKGALALSFETANKHGSTVILANDPDADRLAVAEKSSTG